MTIVTKKECEKALQKKISDEHFKVLFNVILSASAYMHDYNTDDVDDFISCLLGMQGFKKSSIYNFRKEVKKILECVQDQ